MKITFASVLLFALIAAMVGSLAGAFWVCIRKGVKGLGSAVQMVVGSLLMFALASGVIGLYEIGGYARTVEFWESLAVGTIGLILFLRGIRQAR